MKLINLLAAGLLLNTAAIAQQTTTLQEIKKETTLRYFEPTGFAYTDNALIFQAVGNNHHKRPLYYYDGTNPIKEVSEQQLNGVSPFMLFSGSYQGKIYFGSNAKNGGALYSWDGKNPVEKLVDVDIAYMKYNSHRFIGNKMYFAYWDDKTNNSYIYELNLDTKELHDITDRKIACNNMTVMNGLLYFYDEHDNNAIYSYNPKTKQITTIPTGLNDVRNSNDYTLHPKGQNPTAYTIDYIETVGSSIFLTITSKQHGRELYEYDGTAIHMIKDFAPGEADGVSFETIAHNGKLYFCGNETGKGASSLYSYDPSSKEITLIKGFSNGNDDQQLSINCSVFCSYNGMLYFSAYEEATGVQLYRYDDKTNKTAMLTSCSENDDNNLAPQYTVMWKGKLYFTGFGTMNLDKVDQNKDVRIFSLNIN